MFFGRIWALFLTSFFDVFFREISCFFGIDFYIDFGCHFGSILVPNGVKMAPKITIFGIQNRPWRPSRLWDASWSPLGSLLAPFWLPLAPFWLPLAPFGSLLAPFRLPLAPFWLPFAPFGLPLAPFGLPFALGRF